MVKVAMSKEGEREREGRDKVKNAGGWDTRIVEPVNLFCGIEVFLPCPIFAFCHHKISYPIEKEEREKGTLNEESWML